MSDLPSGSTVGGKLIIHKGIANKHRHHVSEIDGLADSANNSQGDGGGIDAAVLSGKTFNDLTNEFLNVSNDSISSLRLANHPTNDNQAASKLYVAQRAAQGFTNGDFYGLTSIGTVSQELSYVILNQYVVRINSTEMMINGWLGVLPTQNIDIRDINPNFTNKSFYLFVESVENSFTITTSETHDLNTPNRIYAGRIDTNGSGIAQVDIVSGVARFGIGKYMLSQTPAPDSIVISKENGLIDDGWLVGSKGETRTFLDGPTQAGSDEVLQYKITNYNSFSDYSVSSMHEDMTVAISGDTVTVWTPITVPLDNVETFVVTRDGFDTQFSLNLIGDPVPYLMASSPSDFSLNSGETVTYTIGNYNPNYVYYVASDVDGVNVESISGDTVTVTTASKNPFEQNGNLRIIRTGAFNDTPITFLADPDIGLTGPDTVFPNNSYTFTITNYNPNYTYTVTSSLGTVSRSGNQVSLNTTGIPASQSGNTLTITVSREGSTATKIVTFRNKYILSAPEDFDPNSGGVFKFAEMFRNKYGIGTYSYGVTNLPEGTYEINISPKSNGIIYNEVDGDGAHGMRFNFDGFTTTSDVRVNISGNVVGRGGHGGGIIDFTGEKKLYRAQSGGDAIHIDTNWSNNPRENPIIIDISNATLYGGGGGGSVSYHIHTTRVYDGSKIVEGVVASGVGGKSALSVPDGTTPPSQVYQTSGTDFSFAITYIYDPDPVNNYGGTIRYRETDQGSINYQWKARSGGAGGAPGQRGGVGFGGLYTDTPFERAIGEYGLEVSVYKSESGSYGTHSSTNYYSAAGSAGLDHNIIVDGLEGYTVIT